MKRILLSVLVLITGWCLQAQVVITLQLPPLGLTIKPQLWNMSVVNSSGTPLNAQLQMIMTDAATNQTVLTAQSPHFVLPAGIKLVTVNDVSPITYTNGVGYMIDPGPNGFLPVGVYNVCYTLTRWTNDISEQLGEECVTVEVEPVSPPQLVMPADSDRVVTYRPFFTWMPPSPVSAFTNLQYDWVLTEVQPMQTAADAIQQNLPLLTQPNIAFTNLQYPLSMPQLDTGKVYAWRVTAKNNGMTVANSEVWSFSIQTTTDTLKGQPRAYYSPLRPEKDGSYITCTGILHYLYTHEMNSASVQVTVTDLNSAAHKPIALDATHYGVQYGVNYIDLDLQGYSGIIDKHMYLLELVNERNEHWYLKFEYRKPNQE